MLWEPWGLHPHASFVTKQGLRSHCTAPCPQGGVTFLGQLWSVGWKQNSKETKGTNWAFHGLSGHSRASARKNDPKCLKPWKMAKRRHKNVLLIWLKHSKWDSHKVCLDQLKTIFAEHRKSSRNAPTNMHSGFMAWSYGTISVTQIQIQDSITVPLGCNWAGLGKTTALRNWNDNMQVFPFLSFVLNLKN